MAAATLATLRYSSSETPPAATQSSAATAAFSGDPNMPWGHFSQPQRQPQQHQQPVLAVQQHALAAAMLRIVLDPASAQPAPTAHAQQQQGGVPTSQPTTPTGVSMAEVWAQVARHVQAGPGVAGSAAAAAGSPGEGMHPNRQQGYGASFSATPRTLQAMGQEFERSVQQMQQERITQGVSSGYLPAGYPVSASYSSSGSRAAAGAGAFHRQDSTNSSGGSFSLPRSSSDAGSAEGRLAGGMSRSMSRFAAEHQQVRLHSTVHMLAHAGRQRTPGPAALHS